MKPVIVFDVNETLLDLMALEPLFERLFGEARILREWFPELILYSQTMTLSGLYVPFGELAAGTLRMVGANHGIKITAEDVDDLKHRIATMPAHADAAPALVRLRDAGYRLVTLTNSPPGPSPSPLERAELDTFFERCFSVEAVERFKPAPETYAHVAAEMGAETSDLCLVACHLWDVIGAQAAGCHGALVTRSHNSLLPAEGVPYPNFTGPDLGCLADQILDRWASA